jgi:hypothetical protein
MELITFLKGVFQWTSDDNETKPWLTAQPPFREPRPSMDALFGVIGPAGTP